MLLTQTRSANTFDIVIGLSFWGKCVLEARAIPRLAERRVVNELWDSFGNNAEAWGMVPHRRAEQWAVFRALWSAQLNGKPLTVSAIVKKTGIPRGTVLRKLVTLQRLNCIERVPGTRANRSAYVIADALLLKTVEGNPSLLDQNIERIVRAADALRTIARRRQ